MVPDLEDWESTLPFLVSSEGPSYCRPICPRCQGAPDADEHTNQSTAPTLPDGKHGSRGGPGAASRKNVGSAPQIPWLALSCDIPIVAVQRRSWGGAAKACLAAPFGQSSGTPGGRAVQNVFMAALANRLPVPYTGSNCGQAGSVWGAFAGQSTWFSPENCLQARFPCLWLPRIKHV